MLELLEGRTLQDEVDGRPLPIDRVIDLGIQIADALDAAHAIGIVHRDIKPANIILTKRGEAKVLDFGLAKLSALRRRPDASPRTHPRRSSTSTPRVPGMTLGTVAFMSPEQARGEELDARTDLFSFGLVLYQMATGRPAFGGQTTAIVFDEILNRVPPPVMRFNTAVPQELERIINKALEKDATFATAAPPRCASDLKRLKRETESGRVTAASASVADRRALRGCGEPVVAEGRAVDGGGRSSVALVGVLLFRYSYAKPSGGPIESMAVLPFVNSSGNPDTEYLTDGITETLINSLSQVPGLRVRARSLAFRYKGKDVDPLKAGQELNVRAVITGRVTTRGNMLIIQSDLVDVEHRHRSSGAISTTGRSPTSWRCRTRSPARSSTSCGCA